MLRSESVNSLIHFDYINPLVVSDSTALEIGMIKEVKNKCIFIFNFTPTCVFGPKKFYLCFQIKLNGVNL